MFFSRLSPRSAKLSGILSRTCRQASSDRQIPPGSLIPSSRAAILTPSPRRSPSASSTTSPRWMPVRTSMRRSGGTAALRSTSPFVDLDRAADRLDHAAELDDHPVAHPLDDPPAMGLDGRIEQFAAERAHPRQRRLLVGAGQAAVADDVGDQDRRDFPSLAHDALSAISSARTRSTPAASRSQAPPTLANPRPESADLDQMDGLRRRRPLFAASFVERAGGGVALDADVVDDGGAELDRAVQGPGPVAGVRPCAAGDHVDVARPVVHLYRSPPERRRPSPRARRPRRA